MKILIAGTSGFIGTQLVPFLRGRKHKVVRLVRNRSQLSENSFLWNPETGEIDLAAFEGVDAVINLSGENVSTKRWSRKRKEEILKSRVQAAFTLSAAISKLVKPPEVYIQTSAVGFYGESKGQICTETSPKGTGFLSDVCEQWEQAASLPIRRVILRLGVVLSKRGGMLQKMISIFKAGLGGKLGSGEQYMSWIDLEDLLSIFLFALTHKNVEGVLNAVAPAPVTNAVFTQTLSQSLKKSARFSIPAWLLRLIVGSEKAEELLLSSTFAQPARLQALGYTFQHPSIDSSL